MSVIVIHPGIDITFFLYSPHLGIHNQCSHGIETRKKGKRKIIGKKKKSGVVPRCCLSIPIGTVLLLYRARSVVPLGYG